MSDYKTLKKEYDNLTKKLSLEEEKCLEKSMSFEEMLNETNGIRVELAICDQKIRLIQEPTMTFGKKWKAASVSLEQFVERSKSGQYKDEDGYGLYGTEKGISDIKIYPSDVLDDRYRNDFTVVYWFKNEN